MENDKDKDKIWEIGEIINQTKRYFAKCFVASPRLDAEILLGYVLGRDRLSLYVHFDQPLEKKELNSYRELVRRRAKGEPVAYLIGEKHFLRLSFSVSPAVLIPRPETELLAEEAIKYCRSKDENIRLLDIGTGSGVLALSVLESCPGAVAVALDVSPDALNQCRENAQKFSLLERVELVEMDVRDFFAREDIGKFDLIVSNPPYIPSSKLADLPREVLREPMLALDGGADGLDFYQLIFAHGKEILLPDGLMLLEIGENQAAEIKKLTAEHDFACCDIMKDYAGLDRIAVIRRA